MRGKSSSNNSSWVTHDIRHDLGVNQRDNGYKSIGNVSLLSLATVHALLMLVFHVLAVSPGRHVPLHKKCPGYCAAIPSDDYYSILYTFHSLEKAGPCEEVSPAKQRMRPTQPHTFFYPAPKSLLSLFNPSRAIPYFEGVPP